MNDTNTYCIQLRGEVPEADLNAIGLVELTTVKVATAATFVTVRTDQSGLIGLLRHLHSRGLVLLSVRTEPRTREQGAENVCK